MGENHHLLQARRIEQKSEGFKERMHQRNGIEGTISELTRAHGMRRTRYRGLAKAYFPAEALKKAFDRTLSAIPRVNKLLERLCRVNNRLYVCYLYRFAIC